MGIANDRPVGLQGSYGVWVTWLHLEPKRPHGVGSSQATRYFRQGPACTWPGALHPAAGGMGCPVEPLRWLERRRGLLVGRRRVVWGDRVCVRVDCGGGGRI